MKNTSKNIGQVEIENSSMKRSLQSKGLTETNKDRLKTYNQMIQEKLNNKKNRILIDGLQKQIGTICQQIKNLKNLVETVYLGEAIENDVRNQKDIRPSLHSED